MVWAFLDQSTFTEYKLELRFEWRVIFGPLYFEIEKKLFNCVPLYYISKVSWNISSFIVFQGSKFIFNLLLSKIFQGKITYFCSFTDYAYNKEIFTRGESITLSLRNAFSWFWIIIQLVFLEGSQLLWHVSSSFFVWIFAVYWVMLR